MPTNHSHELEVGTRKQKIDQRIFIEDALYTLTAGNWRSISPYKSSRDFTPIHHGPCQDTNDLHGKGEELVWGPLKDPQDHAEVAIAPQRQLTP